MKIFLPKRVPMRYLFPFLGAVLALQVVEGTSVITSAAYGLFILVTADAFNTVGGLVYPSGSYIFFAATLTVILGGLTKTALGESLDSNLLDAQKTMLVYLAGAGSLWVAAKINARIRRKTPLLINYQLDESRLRQTALGSALLGQYGWIIIPAAVTASFNQVNSFLPLGLLLAVYDTVKKSGGRRSFSILGFLIWFWLTVFWGIFTFSKQGIFAPSAVWLIAATIAGYHVSLKKAVIVSVLAIVASAILTPVSQIGRIYRGDPDSQEKAIALLMHPLDTRAEYLAKSEALQSSGAAYYHWFNQPQGLLDRLTMFPIDDALIYITDHGHPQTLFPIFTYVTNMIPRYFVKEKPIYHWGNRYAHELGMLGPNDTATGISFSPFSDGYHCGQWIGVTAVAMPIFLMMFWVCDSVSGSTEQTIWATTYILIFSHNAPEGLLSAPFSAISTNLVAVVLAAVISRYFTPIIGSLFLPPSRQVPQDMLRPQWKVGTSHSAPSVGRTIEQKL